MSIAAETPQPAAPTLLVIEDDLAIVDLLEELLTASGYRVEYATTGPGGLSRFQAGRVDLVLLDVDLPGLSGLELCRTVRATAEVADGYVPIIMVTGMVHPAACRAGFAAGADDYLLKPFDLQELLARITVWLRVRSQLRAAATMQEAQRDRVRGEPSTPMGAAPRATGEMADRLSNLLTAVAYFMDLLYEDSTGFAVRQRRLLTDARRGLVAAVHTAQQLQQVTHGCESATRGALPSDPELVTRRGPPTPNSAGVLVQDNAVLS